jgi:hypothetical protein
MPITRNQAIAEIKKASKLRVISQEELDRQSKLKRILSHYDAIANLSSEVWHEPETNYEWYTPKLYVEMARDVMGSITLDPASCDQAQRRVQADHFYTQEYSGLEQRWWGNIWCNPPYGRLQRRFVSKAIALYRGGHINQAIFLLNRTGASWYLRSKEQCTAICEVYKRISFISPEGVMEKSPRYYNDFLYLGKNRNGFRDIFQEVGNIYLI